MGEVTIEIKNCNCIKSADIKLEEGTLNIKYGSNGTGKSTISKAVFLKTHGSEEELQTLLPYGADKGQKCEVDGISFNKVMVFDESYVNSYLFKEKSFLENSFRVFLRSEECDRLANEITNLLAELQGIFQENEAIQNVRSFLPKYAEAVKYSDGEISKKGGVGEFLKGNGAGFDKYDELKVYKPFYDRDLASVSKWAKWRNDGIKQMNGETCPFCADELKKEIEKQNKVISKVFKNSALSTANAVLEYLREAVEKNYIKADALSALQEYISSTGKEDSLESELQNLAVETEYLYKKIDKICQFRPMNVTHEELENIEKNLNEMYVDKRQISKFYSTDFIYTIADEVEEKINNLKENTGKLRGLFIQHEKKMDELITKRKDDINQFFLLAGFPYKFEIRPDGENKAVSYLIPINTEDVKVSNPDTHLSWGEKNAFSLVMFMFEAVSENADLIVLDDPITSFDKDKKFAVIRRLFDNQKVSFRDKTVLMLTHDMQPLIDYVHNDFFKRMGLTTPVKAKYLQNENGIINEFEIFGDDLINTVELTKSIADDSNRSMAVRIVNLRKYIELTKPGFAESDIYEVISNIIHGRKDATLSDGETALSEEVKTNGMNEIESFLGISSYDDVIETVSSKKLFDILASADIYEKIITVRLLFERYDGLLAKLKKKYPAACKFVNETNHIENDYIFQLDPFKFFQIPQFYLSEIETFLEDEKDTIINGFDKDIV
jgi:ABC-type Mn2+/Zn2+ transport system ATPase subunit